VGYRYSTKRQVESLTASCVLALWSRFTVKQTYDELRPKRTFIPHVSSHKTRSDDCNADIAMHGPQSMQHGWEWYEMGFVTCWKASGHLTLLCFDMPTRSQAVIQSMLCSQHVDTACPYAVFSLISHELLRLYDNSVWSIRNHISQWEAVSRAFHTRQPTVSALMQGREGHKRLTIPSCTRSQDTAYMSARRWVWLYDLLAPSSNTTTSSAQRDTSSAVQVNAEAGTLLGIVLSSSFAF
jgi:hypothetical protein